MNEEKQKWVILEDDEVVHVVPDFDDEPHSSQTTGDTRELSDLDCPCKPQVTFDNKTIVVHNSFIDMKRVQVVLDKL